MNTFGLGLVLSFVDNASSGMAKASSAFQQMSGAADGLSQRTAVAQRNMSATASALGIVGDGLMRAGNSITNTMVGIGKTVITTGQQFSMYRAQLNKLYGGPDEGEAVLGRVKAYAQETSFVLDGLLSSVTSMKVVGIEALDDVTTSTGNTTQTLLAYASDLASMIPSMRNAYGSGAAAAAGAFKEYIAEGNALTMKRGAGLDITGILGEDKGKTPEKRLQQIADLIEKIGVAGYTQDMFGAPYQIIANLEDYWVNFVSDVSDKGVWESYGKVITKIGAYVKNLVSDQGRYNALVEIMSGYVTWLLDVADRVVDFVTRVTDSLTAWAEKNPEIVKTLMKVITVAGGLMIFGGILMKIVSLFMLINRLTTMFGITSASVFGNIAKVFITKLLPLAALAGIIKYAWDNNLGAIQQKVRNVLKIVELLIKSFGLKGDANGKKGLLGFADENDRIEAEQLGILSFIESVHYMWERVKNFFKGFNEGFGEAIEWVFSFIMAFDSCTKQILGFVKGIGKALEPLVGEESAQQWEESGKSVGKFFGWLAVGLPVLWAGIKVYGLVSTAVRGLGAAFQFLISPIGLVILAIAAITAAFIWCYHNVEWFKEFLDGWAAGFQNAIGLIGLLFEETFGKIGKAFQEIFGVMGEGEEGATSFGDVLSGILVGLTWAVTGLFAIVVGVVNGIALALIPFMEFWRDLWDTISFFVEGVGKLFSGDFSGAMESFSLSWQSLGDTIWDLFETVGALLQGLWDGIVTTFLGFGIDIEKGLKTAWDAVAKFFSGVWQGIVGVFQNIVAFFASVWAFLTGLFSSIGEGIKTALVGAWNKVKEAWNAVSGFFSGVWTNITNAFSSALEFFQTLGTDTWGKISGAFSTVSEFFGGVWTSITEAFSSALEFFQTLGTDMWGKISGAFSTVSEFFGGVWTSITEAFSSVSTWFSTTFSSAWTAVETAFDTVSTFFTGIWNSITGAFADPKQWFTDTFGGVWEAVSGLFDVTSITQLGIDFITGFVSGVGDTITTKVEEVKGFFGQIWDGVKTLFGIHSASTVAAEAGGFLLEGFTDGISSALEGAIEKVKNFFGQIWSAILGIFGGGDSSGQTEEQKAASEMGTSVVNGVAGGLTGSEEDAKAAAKQIGESMLTSLSEVFGLTEGSVSSPVAEALSKQIVEGLKLGFSGTVSTDFDPAAQAIIDAITSSLETKFSVKDTKLWGKGAESFKGFGTTIVQGIVWGIEDSKTLVTDALTGVGDTNVLNFLTGNEDVLTSWKTLCGDILGTVAQLQTDIATKVTAIGNTFTNVTWKLPKIKLPTIKVTWSTNSESIKIPSFDVTWHKKGGIFDSPTIFNTNQGVQGVGEAGAEAIIPISELWSEMTQRMRDVVTSVRPATSSLEASTYTAPLETSARAASSVTSSSSSSTDNSVVFEKGSISMHLQGTSEKDADKFVDMVMKKIERKKQIKGFTTRSQEATV